MNANKSVMADHTDDTILDDELDDNDYNFDNENEDDLLADNEYDLIGKTDNEIEENPTNKASDAEVIEENNDIEQLEVEEDVLDIGLVDEDVDPDLQDSIIATSQRKDEIIQSISTDIYESEEILIEKNLAEEVSETKKLDSEAAVSQSNTTTDEIRVTCSSPIPDYDRENDDKTHKSKVISLRKSVRKSYDDLPELAKVIQPSSSSSRNHKLKRSSEVSSNRKERSDAETTGSKHYDYDERRRREVSRHGHDRDRDSNRDRDWDRHQDRNRDRIHDQDRDRNRDRDYSRSLDYRDDYSHFSDDNDNPPKLYRESNDNCLDSVRYRYEQKITTQIEIKSESHFQNASMQYPPKDYSSVQHQQEHYDFQMGPSNLAPLPPNHFGPPTNSQSFIRTFRPRLEHMRPPLGPPGMPPQHSGFPQEMNRPPPPSPHQMGFRPPNLALNQRFPQPRILPRGPPLHMHPPNMNGPQPPPQQVIRRPGPPPLMRPSFPPPGAPFRPMQQPISTPVDQMKPLSHQNMPPPVMRLPAANEHMLPPIVGHPPRQAPPNNFPPPNNSIRMGQPFRMNVPPPTNVSQRPVGPPYFKKEPQFHGAVNPAIPYSQSMNQIPPYSSNSNVSGQLIRPMSSVMSNNQADGNLYTNAPICSNVNYSQYPPQNYNQIPPERQYSEYSDSAGQYGTGDAPGQTRKRSNFSLRDSPSKLVRYDGISSGQQEDEDEEMKAYREKVEHQKRLRDKYVQEKEEQRLKNQMQSFIQNNIKGILEKREQLMRKSELESVKQSRDSNRNVNSRRTDSSSERQRRSVSPIKKYADSSRVRDRERDGDRSKNRDRDVIVKEKFKVQTSHDNSERADVQRCDTSGKNDKHEYSEAENDRRQQLHKVVRITYKDGSVALKSIPVPNINSSNTKQIASSDVSDITPAEEELNSGSTRRRMVVSKQIPLPNIKNELSENLIVESVRKSVAQSNMSLAKRFSNLKAIKKYSEEEEESLNAAKLKNRLVIPDEDGTRTVWIKNISASTNPAVIQKMAGTCGSVSRANWIYGGGFSPNNAKITFCKAEDAKKFCQNFNRKTVDVSVITVSMVSDAK